MTHVNIGTRHPKAYKAQIALATQVIADAHEAGLDDTLIELVKLRVSQINGCAFCLRLHSADALSNGEQPERLAILPAWWESQYFTEVERAALQLAEQVTLPGDYGSLPDRGAHPETALTEEQYSAVAWLAVLMNGWNRIAVTSHYAVAP
ncbi:carboxymuconolactone decarboxylase family protein [Alloalcanivorax gelatiniphagus]